VEVMVLAGPIVSTAGTVNGDETRLVDARDAALGVG
jgi:hypothetical protein